MDWFDQLFEEQVSDEDTETESSGEDLIAIYERASAEVSE